MSPLEFATWFISQPDIAFMLGGCFGGWIGYLWGRETLKRRRNISR